MKNSLFTILFTFLIFDCFSQRNININTNFNWAYSNKNIEVELQKKIRNQSVSLGSNINLNIPFNDNQLNVFKNRYISDDFISRFGLSLNYNYFMIFKNSDILPFIFYNFRYFKSKIYIDGLMPYGTYKNSQLLIKYDEQYTNKLPVIENNIGLGISFKLYKKVYLISKIGIGIGFFYLDKDAPFVRSNYWEWSVTTLISVGLSYNLTKKI